MKKDIYDALNDGNFNADEYIINEELNDFEKMKIKNNIRKRKSRKGKKALVAVACGLVVFVGANTTTGMEVVADVVKFATGIDLSKNYDKDYIVEVDKQISHDGLNIKLDEVYRNGNELRIVYTMNFEGGVPDSVKANFKSDDDEVVNAVILDSANIELTDSMKEAVAKGDLKIISKEEFDELSKRREAEQLEKGEVYVNGVSIYKIKKINMFNTKEEAVNHMENNNTGKPVVWYSTIRDLSVTENTLQRELIMNLKDDTLEEDLNIQIKYNDIKLNNGDILKGEWILDHTVNKDSNTNEIQKTPLEGNINFSISDGRKVKLESFANTNTGFKIYGVDNEVGVQDNKRVIRLEGIDNLGNKIVMYPKYKDYVEGAENKLQFTLYDGPEGMTNNRLKLEDGVTSIKFRMYEDKVEFKNGQYNQTFIHVGDEFEVKLK
ncbi:MAG: DUF4179 domain-containing protein [Clostridium sp.]